MDSLTAAAVLITLAALFSWLNHKLRVPAKAGTQSRKLSYKETRELESLPKEIDALEAEQKALHAKMSEPDYYKQPPDALRADQARHGEIEKLLMEKLERWHALESIGASHNTDG